MRIAARYKRDESVQNSTDEKDKETYAIIGAALEVHKELGHGFLESVYQEALAIEFSRQKIPFKKECPVPIYYKGELLKSPHRADFLCYDSIIVELKALSIMSGTEEAQVIHYLKATKLKKALLFNFGKPSLEFKRIVLSY
jgi:GxxExxY protein